MLISLHVPAHTFESFLTNRGQLTNNRLTFKVCCKFESTCLIFVKCCYYNQKVKKSKKTKQTKAIL